MPFALAPVAAPFAAPVASSANAPATSTPDWSPTVSSSVERNDPSGAATFTSMVDELRRVDAERRRASAELAGLMKLVLMFIMTGSEIPPHMIKLARAAGMESLATGWEQHNRRVRVDSEERRAAQQRDQHHSARS